MVIILSAIFTIYSTDARCSTTYAENDPRYETILSVNNEIRKVADEYKTQSIFFFSESDLIKEVNEKVPRAEAYDVECVFPNKIVVRYNLIEESVQIKCGADYIIASASGKIMDVRKDDTSYVTVGGENNTLISVVPYSSPNDINIGHHLYDDPKCYDMAALDIIVGLADNLVDASGDRAFDKSNYAEIILADSHSEESLRDITVRMRGTANGDRVGITLKLQGGGLHNLELKMKSFAAWYISHPDKIYGGTAIITDGNPDRVIYSAAK